MKQPPTIQPANGPGPAYDPMDRIVEDLQNIESFLMKLEDDPTDLKYLDSHLANILALRRTISHQLDLLSEDPYNYLAQHLSLLHKENEKIFSHLEGAVGSMKPLNKPHFKKFIEAAFQSLEKFDSDLTP
jgi:hypothetical protein